MNSVQPHESGNILLIILIAIALLAALNAAIQGSSQTSGHIDNETLIMRVSEVERYAGELKRAVDYVMQSGKSEGDMRFAHPNAPSDYGNLSLDSDTTDQIFDKLGGGASYRDAPNGVNDGSGWEFYGQTTLPEVGTGKADLIAVLPNVTPEFCDKVNATVGYSAQPEDSATCLNSGATGRFDDATHFNDSTTNTVTTATFSVKPAMEACVECTADGSLHYYYVLMVR